MLEKRLTLLRSQFRDLNFAKLSRVFPQIEANIDKLGEIQEYRYQDKKLAAISLVHRSSLVYWPTDKSGIFSNERLEFLGDAFLSFFKERDVCVKFIYTCFEKALPNFALPCHYQNNNTHEYWRFLKYHCQLECHS